MPTDCTGWDVRTMVLHVLGSADAQASFLTFVHQLRRGMPLNKKIESHHWVDGMNELQIRERSHLSNAEVIAQLEAIGPKAVRARWRTPPPARYLPLPFGPPFGWVPLKYLLDVGFTRDVWCHRIDLHAAIGGRCTSPPSTTAASSATSSPSGPTSTATRSSWCSKDPPAASTRKATTASASRSTPSTSSARFPVAWTAPACSATPSLSDQPSRNRKEQRTMETRVDEIADRIYRLSTLVPDIGPTGFTFNQFVIDADEPVIFHTGPRGMFPLVSAAVASVVPLDRLRWIMFGHVESDECGAMNEFLAAAPNAQIAHRPSGAWCRSTISPIASRGRWAPTKCSTSEAGASATSTRRTCPTGGTRM